MQTFASVINLTSDTVAIGFHFIQRIDIYRQSIEFELYSEVNSVKYVSAGIKPHMYYQLIINHPEYIPD